MMFRQRLILEHLKFILFSNYKCLSLESWNSRLRGGNGPRPKSAGSVDSNFRMTTPISQTKRFIFLLLEKCGFTVFARR